MTPLPSPLDGWTEALSDAGLTVWGVADATPALGALPGERRIVVVGSAGPALGQAFRRHVAASTALPDDPLDAFVAARIASLPAVDGTRWWSGRPADPPLDLRGAAIAAGLGWRSRLDLVLHPQHGLWIGLRAACYTTFPLPVTGPLPAPAPCEPCDAPCARACPANAVTDRGWAFDRCLPHQARTEDCVGGCRARVACPVGRGSAYDPDIHRYHHHPPSRPALIRAWRAA